MDRDPWRRVAGKGGGGAGGVGVGVGGCTQDYTQEVGGWVGGGTIPKARS